MRKHKLRKRFFYSLIFFIYLILMLFLLFDLNLFKNFSSVRFDKNKLIFASSQAQIFDLDNKEIKSDFETSKLITYNDLPQHVIDAFVSIEDKRFFEHKGINYKRIAKAIVKDLVTRSKVEGASTISQQLIKNTHLTNKKTLKRKIDEILLTKTMEKTLSKKEIFSAYLNAIYFGSNTFGIKSASQRYFSKNVSNLTLTEGATLAGIIKSPKKYSPVYEPENCLKRRNLVLKEMFKDKKISKDEYDTAIKQKLKLNINGNFIGGNDYSSNALEEACNVLKTTKKDLIVSGYKIYTYLDSTVQSVLEKNIKDIPKLDLKNCKNEKDIDRLCILIDNSTGGIIGYYGKSDFDLNKIYRQPGSVIKPLISYAPAIEYNLISPITPILDQKYEIGEYMPKNYKNKYYGWISAKDALAKSLNIPSVKLLESVGIERAKRFCNNMGLKFDKDDKNLSLALGGLTKGVKILDMANCYQALANGGNYIKGSFVREIRDANNKIIYKNLEKKKNIMKDSTAFLITDMLQESVKNGTSKLLKNSKYEIAAKTGTVGINNAENENSDLWNISYTKDITTCVWCGTTKKNTYLDQTLTGGNLPTLIAKNVYGGANLKTSHFDIPKSVKKVKISKLDLDENKICLASVNTPERYTIESFFATDNIPKQKTTLFDEIEIPNLEVKKTNQNNIVLSFECKNFLEYTLIREDEDNRKKILNIKNKNGIVKYTDKDTSANIVYNYYLEVKYMDNLKLSGMTKTSNVTKIYLAQKKHN